MNSMKNVKKRIKKIVKKSSHKAKVATTFALLTPLVAVGELCEAVNDTAKFVMIGVGTIMTCDDDN